MKASTRLAFDRGTLLLDRFENDGAVLAAVPDVRFDARVERYRAPAHRLESVRDALDRRGIGVEGPPPARLLGPVAGFGAIELRPYQDAALGAWAVAHRRGVVVLPTGAGKTRLAIGAIARARAPAICLVPTRVLLEQRRREIARVYSGPVGCLGDGSAEIAPITVSTFESAYRRMPEIGDLTVRLLAVFDLVILELQLTPCENAAQASNSAPYRASLDRFEPIPPEGDWPSFARGAASGRATCIARPSPESRRARSPMARSRALSHPKIK